MHGFKQLALNLGKEILRARWLRSGDICTSMYMRGTQLVIWPVRQGQPAGGEVQGGGCFAAYPPLLSYGRGHHKQQLIVPQISSRLRIPTQDKGRREYAKVVAAV